MGAPLVEEIAVCVDDIGFAQLTLHQGHDVRQIRFAYVLSVQNFSHALERDAGEVQVRRGE